MKNQVCKGDCVWNSTTCTCEIDVYLKNNYYIKDILMI